MGDVAEKKDEFREAATLLLRGEGRASIQALMRLAGVEARTVEFNLRLHAVCEAYFRATGCHVRERKGALVVSDRGPEQLRSARRLARASERKSRRALSVGNAVDRGNLTDAERRSLDRFLSRGEGRANDDRRVQGEIAEKVRRLMEQENYVVNRERRPRSE